MQTYLYRFVEATDSKLEHHLERIHEAGDIPEHVIFKGGRDYVIVVRHPAPGTVGNLTLAEFRDLLNAALAEVLGPFAPAALAAPERRLGETPSPVMK